MSQRQTEIETIYGKPIGELLPMLFACHETMHQVEIALGVQPATLRTWMMQLAQHRADWHTLTMSEVAQCMRAEYRAKYTDKAYN